MEQKITTAFHSLSNNFRDRTKLWILLENLTALSEENTCSIFDLLYDLGQAQEEPTQLICARRLADLMRQQFPREEHDDDGVDSEHEDAEAENDEEDVVDDDARDEEDVVDNDVEAEENGDEEDVVDGDAGDDENLSLVVVDACGRFCFCKFCGQDKSCTYCRGEESMICGSNLIWMQQSDYCRTCQQNIFGKNAVTDSARSVCDCHEKKLACANCVCYGNAQDSRATRQTCDCQALPN